MTIREIVQLIRDELKDYDSPTGRILSYLDRNINWLTGLMASFDKNYLKREIRATFNSGVYQVRLPDTLLINRINKVFTSNNKELYPLNYEDMRRLINTSSGTPKFYSLMNTLFYLYPTPNTSTNIFIHYDMRLPRLIEIYNNQYDLLDITIHDISLTIPTNISFIANSTDVLIGENIEYIAYYYPLPLKYINAWIYKTALDMATGDNRVLIADKLSFELNSLRAQASQVQTDIKIKNEDVIKDIG